MAAFPSRASESRPLKVALFSDSALPVANGVAVSVDLLMRSLREKGHLVYLWTTRFPRHRDEDPCIRRFLGSFTPIARNYPLAFPPFYPWFAEFRRLGFDVVHTHTPFTVGFVGMRWAESLDIPFVTTYHTHYDRYAHYVPILPQPYVRFKIAKHTHYYYNRARTVITPSRASESWLKRHSVTTPVEVIPTGIEPPLPLNRAELRAKLGLEPGELAALFVGRMAPEKNLDLLIRTAARAMTAHPSLRLIMVGHGPSMGEAKELAESLGVGGKVRIEGAKTRREVEDYYAASDIFFFCSVTETQGLVVAEAMNYGLPVVLARGGGAADLVEDGVEGYVCGSSEEDLAGALSRLASDPGLRASMGKAARKTAAGASVEAMTEAILKVYREAAIEPPAPSQA